MSYSFNEYTYTIKLTRSGDDEDGRIYHDGTDAGAIAQVARELQEAMEMSGEPAGSFQITKRKTKKVVV